MDTTAPALTIAQRRVLEAVTKAPSTARQMRDRMGLPRSASALASISAVLDVLASAGRIVRDGSNYRLP